MTPCSLGLWRQLRVPLTPLNIHRHDAFFMVDVAVDEVMGEQTIDNPVHHPVVFGLLVFFAKVKKLGAIVVLDVDLALKFLIGKCRGMGATERHRQVSGPKQPPAVQVALLTEVFEE